MKTKVLLVGCGEHSLENIVPSLKAIPTIEVLGLVDPSQEALSRAANWFPSAKTTTKERLDDADIAAYDAVVAAAPPQLHEHVAQLAIDQGKPIFVEKPPTITTDALRLLAGAALKGRIVTCVGHNLRHSEAAIQFRNATLAPDFGRCVAMEMRYYASKPRGDRWGLQSPLRSFLLSHANHAIDLMIYQMGEIQEVVAARAWPDIDGGIAIAAQLIFKSRAVGTLIATSYAPYFTLSASVISDAGQIANLNSLHEVQVLCAHDMGKRWHNEWKARTLETGYRFAGYQTELERFFIAIENGSPDDIHPSLQDEVAIYEAMDRIEQHIEKAPGSAR